MALRWNFQSDRMVTSINRLTTPMIDVSTPVLVEHMLRPTNSNNRMIAWGASTSVSTSLSSSANCSNIAATSDVGSVYGISNTGSVVAAGT